MPCSLNTVYKFCPKCGGSLYKEHPNNEHVERLLCSLCNFVFYQNPKPTASILLIDDNKVLLVKRAVEPAKGEWDLPGGFIEEHEHPKDTVKREMLEELGVQVEILNFTGIFMDKYGYDGGSTLNIYYTGRIISGAPSPNDDICECRWFSFDDLPPKMAFNNNEEALNICKAVL